MIKHGNSNTSPLRTFTSNFVFFQFWHKAQESVNQWSTARRMLLLSLSILVGITLRMWAQTSFRNYDFESYLIVSKLLVEGDNPYDSGRYNYGPNWMFFLTFTRYLFEDPDSFRLLLAVTLTLADIGIAIILFKRGHSLASLILMVSPISVAITGQHQQFDNIAVLLMLTAMFIYRPTSRKTWTTNDTYVLILISLSITTKHVFIFFLFWFALKQPGIRKRIIFLVGPVAILLLSLIPFFVNSPKAVIEHVFLYASYNNAPLLSMLIPNLEEMDSVGRRLQQVVFVAAVLLTGYVMRKCAPFTLALVYTVTLVVFTSALADQYLSIAVVGAAVFFNIGFLIWMALGSIYLLGNPATLAVPGFTSINQSQADLFLMTSNSAYQVLSSTLFVGWVIMLFAIRKEKQTDFHETGRAVV